MSAILAGLLFAHGVAHLVGFAAPWGLIDRERVMTSGNLLNGLVHVGPGALRAIGLVWLVLAVGFFVAGGGIARGDPRWISVVTWSIIASSVMCVVGWPATRVGLAVNLALLITVTAGARLGWL